MVKVFQTFANERQLQKLFTRGLSIESAIDYTPKPGDSDYLPKNDVPWIKRFASAGGKVVISGNTAMRRVSPERLALVEEGMIVIFFEDSWNNKRFFTKCAFLMHEASELGEKLEQTVHMALNEVVAILGFSLNPDDRAFTAILKAKTTILSSVLNAQVRIDETRFETGKKDRLEGILAIAERSLSHLESTYGR
jgi:hypothetical protein